ncbi:MAG TPA: 50S ribosomal protein L21 [Alphaproteobacteria bacterium]|nr:50S ribosomal protein L21 [Alphaproteobacteria bacterium]
MYAVIQSGGKQYKVASGDVVRVEKLEAEKGKTVQLADVLAIGEGDKLSFGNPLIKGASVSAEVVGHEKTDKVIVFKKKRRQNYRRKKGHRQNVTVLKITGISGAKAA